MATPHAIDHSLFGVWGRHMAPYRRYGEHMDGIWTPYYGIWALWRARRRIMEATWAVHSASGAS